MPNTELTTFEISTRNFPRFQKEFDRLARKAKKLKVEQPTWHLLEVRKVPAEIDRATNRVVKPAYELKVISVSGQAPKVNGWTFVAVLQHEKGGNLVHRVPGTEGIKVGLDMRTVAPWCDQCRTKRNRLDTYVVAHDDGRQMQVGGDCLRDFTGHDSPESLARWAELLATFKHANLDDEDFAAGDKYERLVEVGEFLGHVAAMIRLHGWLSRTKARELNNGNSEGEYQATADLAWANKFPPSYEKPVKVEDEDRERATAALTYALGALEAREDAGLDDYEHNLRLTLEARAVASRGAGIAASTIIYAERLMARELENKQRAARARVSRYQGEVKKRQTFDLTVTKVVDLFSQVFGASNLHLMNDKDGNVFVWKTASERLEVGKTYKLAGTVKEHKLYEGRNVPPVEQTVLTRCKIL